MTLSMLKHPNSDVDFVVTPAYFVGVFNVYDREETLGVRLATFDPNDEEQLVSVMDEFFFNGAWVASLSPEHRNEMLRVLASALADASYDFDALISDEAVGEYFYLPAEWEIRDAREFFSRIYQLALARWK